MAAKPRLFYLDLVRAAALACILVIHFNASVTGYFVYPSQLFASWLPGGIYLGDFGSSLFFIVSGASLMYTAWEPFACLAFYKKRAAAVYPMFWLAWFSCFAIRFITQPGSFAAAKTATLALTAAGLDQYALAAGWVSADFACVGEWFLGSILFLYLLFPLLRAGLLRRPLVTWAVVLCCALPVHFMGWDARLFAIHLPEFLFGMSFVHFVKNPKPRLAAWLLVWPLGWGVSGLAAVDGKVLCAAVSMAVFAALAGVAQYLAAAPVRACCRLLGQYSYALFLLHHVIALRLMEGRDLSAVSRRDTVFLFAIYLAGAGLAAWGLYHTEKGLRKRLCALTCPAVPDTEK